jgi:chromatin remodeling complex protein RSC6
MTMSPNQGDPSAHKLKPSAALVAIVGSDEPLNRVEATDLVLKHIESHALRRPGSPRQIVVDAVLRGMLQYAHIEATTAPGFEPPIVTLEMLAEVINENLGGEIYE